MSFISVNTFMRNYDVERQHLFRDLTTITRDVVERYGNKAELATEEDPKIVRLFDCWELVLFYGLRTSVFKSNITFFALAETHLTRHEKERFQTLRNVHTDVGKFRALLRAALNERSLYRYLMCWINDDTLQDKFESFACLLNAEIKNALPGLAKSLTNILFALTVDSPDLDHDRKLNVVEREEPIIPIPEVKPTKKHRKQKVVERDIIDKEIEKPILYVSSQGTTSTQNSFQEFFLESNPAPPEIINGILEPIEQAVEPPVEESSEGSTMSSQNSVSRESVHEPQLEVELEELKLKLKERDERILQLENQVAALSLENCRLRMISCSSRQKIFFSVTIPRAFLERQLPSGKKYYIYEIHVTPANDVGEAWVVKRRYSEFYSLYEKLGAHNPSIKALDFPPKKNFGNMDAMLVEQRRQRLHLFLKHLISMLPEVAECCSRSELVTTFPFLDPDARL